VILSTTENIPGRAIRRFFGVVSGSTVRSKHIGRDLMAGIKNIFGGELKGYTELLQESRENAIVNVRFATSSITQGAAELFAYGTAVQVD